MLALSSLITKLSKREKFFFHQHCKGSEGKAFFKLYKYLESNPNTDFKSLKEEFTNTSISNNLSVELNHLQKRILRSLHIFRLNNKSITYTMLKNISYVRILHEKKETTNAIKLIKQTKKIGYRYEEFSFLTQLLILEEEIGYNTIDAVIHNTSKELRQEREKITQLVNELIVLKGLKTRIIELQYQEGNYVSDPKMYPEVFKSKFATLNDYQNSRRGKDHFYLFKSILFSLLGKTEKSLKYNNLKYQNIKDNQHIFTAVDEIKSMNNILFHYIILNDSTNFYKQLEVFKTYENRPGIPPELFAYFKSYLQLRFELKNSNLDRLNLLIPYTEKILKTLKFNDTQNNLLHHYLTGALIVTKDFSKAQDVLLSWDKIKKIPYVNNAIKIARLIIYKELGNINLLKNEIRNFKKTVKIKNEITELFLSYFNSHIKEKNKMTGSEFYNKLLKLSKKNELKKYFIEFYFLSWGKSVENDE